MMINIQKRRRKQTLAEELIRNNTDIFYPKLHAQCPKYSRDVMDNHLMLWKKQAAMFGVRVRCERHVWRAE